MQGKYDYEEALKFNDELPPLSQEDFCALVGTLIDTGYDRQEVTGIEKGMHFAQLPIVETFEDFWRGVLFYYTANGWASLQRLQSPTGPDLPFSLESKEKEQEILCLRKALSLVEQYNSPGTMAQILTNLGNALDHVGRFVEAVEYWKWALSLLPDFGMAMGNLGFGLVHYAKILYDEGHRFVFCQFAYHFLQKGIASEDSYPEAKKGFGDAVEMIANRYGVNNLTSGVDLDNFSLGRSKKEQHYRKWCINENLFLNPLNDVVRANIVAHDCFYLPGMTTKLDDPPLYFAIYNQLKQEYASARYLLYEGITADKPHFSDKGNFQVDTLDYAVYSLGIEKIKIAFRIGYSIFDKIAYLLNDYLEVGLRSHEVNFRRVWYKNGNIKQGILNPLLLNSQNLALRGLYWLSKDLISVDTEFTSSILPEANKLVAIRNFIEHKSFMVVDIGKTEEVHDEMTMQITRDDLINNTFVLMRTARAAMMYISFAIHIEEQKTKSSNTIPMYMQEMSQKFKI